MLIHELTPNTQVEGRYLVVRKELRQGGRAGNFLDLILCDATGRVAARIWENAVSIGERFEVGQVIEISGRTELYKDELQLRLENVHPLSPDEAKPSDYLPHTEKDIALLEQRLVEFIKSISNPYLRQLLLNLFQSEEISSRFRAAPAAKALHHSYVGGLLEHTVEVSELCEKVCEIFPTLDRDLLLASAVLHDIGKLEELSWQTAFDYTDQGHLLGHLILGERQVRQEADKIEGFPEEMKLLLSHMILSHHGAYEFGSPKLPMTAEAIALHHAEDLDAKVNMFLREIASARDQDKRWTERHFLLGRPLYVGKTEEAEATATDED